VIPPEVIPEGPPHHIAYIDGYGNLKTTIKQGTFTGPLGSTLRIRIGVVKRAAVLSDGSFAVESGQLAFALGSSGWRLPSGHETRWMEIFLRGGNA
jgi:S-adenosylmethionine hydrolase